MWDSSSLTRNQTHISYIGRQILNHWTTRDVPRLGIFVPELNGRAYKQFCVCDDFMYALYFWLLWSFLLMGFSLVAASRSYSLVAAPGLNVCGTRAQLLCGMWDLSRPGIEPMSPTLAGRFFTTEPPGKTKVCDFF